MKLKRIITILLLTCFLTLNTVSASTVVCQCDSSQKKNKNLLEESDGKAMPCHQVSENELNVDHGEDSHSCDGSCSCHLTHSVINVNLPASILNINVYLQSEADSYQSPILSSYLSQLKRPPKTI